MYAQNGDVEKALNLLHQMQTGFGSGKNKDCRPDMHTYASVLNALKRSSSSDAVDNAEQIFYAIPLPDTITYTTLISMYAERGMAGNAVSLTRRMQSDFDAGKNRSCLPNEVTKLMLLKQSAV
jgi:pentatricopeptide repeat protein